MAGVGVSVVAVIALTGCGSTATPSANQPTASVASSEPTSTPAPASGTTPAAAAITIKGFKYTVPASVAAGAMVRIADGDSENHTLTADSGAAFDVKAPAGATATFAAPSKPGSYPFHCTYHANMHGVLIVK